MIGLGANLNRSEAQKRLGLAQAIAAAFDPEAMVELAQVAGVPAKKIAEARMDLLHERARESALSRFGGS